PARDAAGSVDGSQSLPPRALRLLRGAPADTQPPGDPLHARSPARPQRGARDQGQRTHRGAAREPPARDRDIRAPTEPARSSERRGAPDPGREPGRGRLGEAMSTAVAHEQVTGPRRGPASPGPIAVEFATWLRELAFGVGSDLHLKVDSPPMIREEGELRRLERA